MIATSQIAVLVVDDDPGVRGVLQRVLARRGYDAATAASGLEALSSLRERSAAVMLLDVNLPDISGVDLVGEALAIDPGLAILMISGGGDATMAARCMQRGAYDYLLKPIEPGRLVDVVAKAVRRRAATIEGRRAAEQLKHTAVEQAAALLLEREKLERLSIATLQALSTALEAKTVYSRGHSARIADLAATVAAELGLDDEVVEHVRIAGRVHDLGMIGIRDEVLNRRGPLTVEEDQHIRQHPVIGADILAPLEHLGPVIGYVRGHHERWDGTGYPDGLAGEAIPFGARILAAAEVYDALTTSRPYQDVLSDGAALERLGELRGTALDPRVVDAVRAVVERRQTLVFIEDSPAIPEFP